MFNKIPFITLIIIIVLAISITLLYFEDLSWNHNEISYFGLTFSFIFLLIKFIFKLK